MPASDAEIIRWRLKYLTEQASELSEGELKWLIIFEEQFKRDGALSPRKMEIIEDIYKRHRNEMQNLR